VEIPGYLTTAEADTMSTTISQNTTNITTNTGNIATIVNLLKSIKIAKIRTGVMTNYDTGSVSSSASITLSNC
jgi:hypothetical protein